jgi:hypothetical protein
MSRAAAPCKASSLASVSKDVLFGKAARHGEKVQRLLACHATSCATERNWSLWGSVYSASRDALGTESGKKLIRICDNSSQARENDFAVSLAVVEEDIEL